MKILKVFCLIGLLLGGTALLASVGWAQSKLETKGPILTHAFAVEKGEYGYIWKIYLEAEDPDGQMLRIGSVVDEAGTGRYPTDWIYLKPQYRTHFKGYLQWNTFSSNAGYMLEGTQIALRVSVFNNNGKESNEVVFPFTFELTPGQYQYQLPPPFDQGDLAKLGSIMIDLYPPDMPGGNGGSHSIK